MPALLKKIRTRLKEWQTRWAMTRGIRHAVARARVCPRFTAETAVDYLFSEDTKEIAPWQYREELVRLAREIEARRPRTVVEIGTASGGTLFLACCLAADDALLVSLDLPDGAYGGGFPQWKVPLYCTFRRNRQRVEIIRGNSHDPAVHDRLKEILGGRKIDYLFLDGDHTYAGVKGDFEAYSRLLADDALVAFHDIVGDKSVPPNHFVSVFWNEIKKNHPYKEFVRDANQSKLGLGALYVKRQAEPA